MDSEKYKTEKLFILINTFLPVVLQPFIQTGFRNYGEIKYISEIVGGRIPLIPDKKIYIITFLVHFLY